MTEEEIYSYQEKLLQKQLRYVYRNSKFFRNKVNEIDVLPEEIKTIEEFRQLPVFMNKAIERENQKESRARYGHSFGTHLSCSPDEIEFIGTTSGTSGNPTFTYTFTKEDLHFLNRYIAHILEYGGVYSGDRLLFSHSLGIYATSSIGG